MKKIAHILTSLVFVIVLVSLMAKTAEAAYFDLTPSSGSYDENASFDVVVGIDSGEDKVYAADVWINFDASLFKVNSVSAVASPAFSFVMGDQNIDNSAGTVKIALNPAVSSSLDAKTAKGSLLTLNLTALKEGNGALSFICTDGSINDANIIEPESVSDIIVCSSNRGASYTVSTGGSTDSVPTATTVVTKELDTTGDTSDAVGGGDELPKTGLLTPVFMLLSLAFLGLSSAVLVYRL